MKKSVFSKLMMFGTLLFLYLPVFALFIQSFNASRFGSSWKGFSLIWYQKLFSDRAIGEALLNSLSIAFFATCISLVLGVLLALSIHSFKSKLQSIQSFFLFGAMVLPDLLTGVSLLMLFTFIQLKLGMFSILLAHSSFCLSYATMILLSRLQGLDPALVEAARDLGATEREAFFKVTFRHLLPAIVSAGLLCLVLSIDDFVITFFVSGPGATTLPLYVYSMIKHGYPPVVNALSVILFLVTLSVVWVSKRLMEKA